MTAPADAPTTELGTPGLTGGAWLETWEDTAELRWPNSVAVYDRIRKSDGKAQAVRRAYRLPILRADWQLNGEGVRPTVLALVSRSLGLPLPGEARARGRRAGVRFTETLSHALLSLDYGHHFAEQVYDVVRRNDVDLGDLQGATNGELPTDVAVLRKLAPRMARSLTGIDVAPDGGLAGIRQHVPRAIAERGTNAVTYTDEVPIPVDRLVAWVNDREGADWTGQSIYRGGYKHWLIRDTLLRLGPMAVERNGLGLPVVYFPEGGDRAEALAIASNVRAGADAGVALPAGWRLELIGVSGSTRDELPLVKYHDEAFGKATLTMFLDLGHDAGARSLGDTFVDVYKLALDSTAGDLAGVYTEHVIRDIVELNFGAGEPYPELTVGRIGDREELTSAGLKELVDAGLLVADDVTRAYVRERHDLPAAPPPEERTDDVALDDAASSPFANVGIPALISAGVISPDDGRALLRLPGAAPGPPASTAPAPVDQLGEADTAQLLARLARLNERVLAMTGARP